MEAGMANLTLRGCDEELAHALKATSRRRGVSVNRLILETLRETILGEGKPKRRHDDLDRLAGTWTEEEAETFERAVAGFEELDNSLWAAESAVHPS